MPSQLPEETKNLKLGNTEMNINAKPNEIVPPHCTTKGIGAHHHGYPANPAAQIEVTRPGSAQMPKSQRSSRGMPRLQSLTNKPKQGYPRLPRLNGTRCPSGKRHQQTNRSKTYEVGSKLPKEPQALKQVLAKQPSGTGKKTDK